MKKLQFRTTAVLLIILVFNSICRAQVFSVEEFGAVPDRKTVNTKAIQKAIDECGRSGGGKVIFPAGEYLTGPLFLKSNVHIEIMAGAKIFALDELRGYPVIDGLWEGLPGKVYASLFTGQDLNNISITGRGVIDGQGQKWWELALITKEMRKKAGILDRETENPPGSPLKYRRPRVINLYNCNNVLIRDITILNAPAWTVHPVYSENVTIDNISIIQPYESPNTDGINPESCKNVRIINCFVDCGDDCVTIKSGYNEIGRKINRPCENIVVSNCTFAHGRSAVGIGSETSGGVRNVVISNCVFQNTYRGLRIKTGRGRGNTVENIRATNITMDHVGTAISIDMYYDDKDETKRPVDETTPFFRNIRYSHISGINIRKAGEIFGLPEAPVEGLTFEDVVLSAETGMEVKFVRDLSFLETEIDVKQGSALKIRDSEQVYLRNFVSKKENGDEPVIVAENVKKAVISSEKTPFLPENYLQEKGTDNDIVFPATGKTVDQRPNILIAIADDQSYIHAGPYGNTTVRTPVLDRLAREGMLFSNAFAASPMCSVSRASLVTGRYPWQNGEAGQHSSHFPRELVPFTDLLEEAGYAIGVSEKGWRPGNWEVAGWSRNPAGPAFTDIKVGSKPSSEISDIDYAANFNAFLDSREDRQPFCFWYGCEEPHSPFEEGSGEKAGYDPEHLTLTPNFQDTSLAVKSHMLDFFLEIEWFDKHLGRMIEILKEKGEYENTIIVVTSDNGSPMPGAKSNLYDYGTHVPLVILWPGRTPRGAITNKLVSQIDLAPTFLDAAGIDPPGSMSGFSFLGFISGENSGNASYDREYVLAAQEKGGHDRRDHLGYPMRSVRTHEYLYIRNFRPERWPKGDTATAEKLEGDPWARKRPAEELYKVMEDPACLKNLAADPAYQQIKNDLWSQLEKMLTDQNDPRVLGYGDIFESFPRYASFDPEIEGFKRRGEYNPKYLMEIPEGIFVSELYYKALEKASENREIPAPTGLLCELLRQPENTVITDSIPEFGWVFPAEGKVQTAYRILVASSPLLLEEGKADLWDCGFILSSQSVNVPYSGKPLEPGTAYFWKVKVRGENNTVSGYSTVQQFHTGQFSGRDPGWPGESRYMKLNDGRWVSENRQTAAFETLKPVQFEKTAAGHWFADFGKAAFGTLEINLQVLNESASLEIYLGERRNPDRTVNKEPGVSNIGFQRIETALAKGKQTWRVELPPHISRYPHSQKLAPFYPEVMPFRYVEIRGLPGQCEIEGLRQLALFYPFDDGASFFRSDNENLNRVWELCKYTLKATPFLGVYADGNRERMPYEADAYIQQLGHYAVDREFSIGRYSADFLIYHASWPTEWQMHTVFMAWEDYMNTGNAEFIERAYNDLKAKTLLTLARDDGLISSRTNKVDPEFLNSIYYNGDQFRDNVDWPRGTPAGEKQARNAGPTPEGERDGYVFTDYNTVINAFHYQSLLLMGKMAEALGYSQDHDFFHERARLVRESFLNVFLDTDRCIFRDGEGTDHASLHANMFPLAFGLVHEEHVETVLAFIRSRGMACSVYGAQYLLEALYSAGEADYALDLMTSEEMRSWMNMIHVGSTMTTEAWDEYYKPNLTWNHAWGSAPANIISRKVMGIEPLEPGFRRFRICPQPGYLDTLVIRKPSIRGAIEMELYQNPESWQLKAAIPGNSKAEIWIPGRFSTILVNGKKVERVRSVYYAGQDRNVFDLESGTHAITAK